MSRIASLIGKTNRKPKPIKKYSTENHQKFALTPSQAPQNLREYQQAGRAPTCHTGAHDMTTKQQLTDHLADLERAREEAYSAGNWERVDLLGQCIDDTKAAIAKAIK